MAPSLRELLSVAKLRECSSLNGMAPGFVSPTVGVANLATRWHEVPLASPGGVAERSESFKIMIASGNHSKIKKLLSEARLMRGGDG